MSRYGFVLCAYSYSVSYIVRLINVLIIKNRLDYILQYHIPTQPRINPFGKKYANIMRFG
jgi:hypothetical protein